MGVTFGLCDRETKECIDLGKRLFNEHGEPTGFQMPAERIAAFIARGKPGEFRPLELHADYGELPYLTDYGWTEVDSWDDEPMGDLDKALGKDD
jgi:hypothetical protein